jgi:hypothetical protein
MMTRESWLGALARQLAPVFKAAGAPIPDNIRVTCGFPSHAALNGNKRQTIGQCWSSSASRDKHFEIMVSPVIDDLTVVAATLAHELVHAAVGLEHGHKGQFRKVALAIGLQGRMTATEAGDAFKRHLTEIVAAIGPYPHARLDANAQSSGPKKQASRLLKCECEECGYTVRITRVWIEKVGLPCCPDHGEMQESAA